MSILIGYRGDENVRAYSKVLLNEEDVARFKSQALKKSKSLSSWLRDAGRSALERNQGNPLVHAEDLRRFLEEREGKEEGREREEHKRLILEGRRPRGRHDF
jgi:hypothetical protein